MSNIEEFDNVTSNEVMTFTSNEDMLNYTMGVRQQLVAKLMKSINFNEVDDNALLLKTLDSMDKQVFSKTRIQLESETAKNAEAERLLIAAVLKQQTLKTPDTTFKNDVVLEIPQEFLEREFVPGETDINPKEIEYDDIMVND